MNLFQPQKIDVKPRLFPTEQKKGEEAVQKYPMLNKNMNFSKLVKNPNKTMFCLALRNQHTDGGIDEYFDTYNPESLTDENTDSFLLTSIFDWSDEIMNNEDMGIEIIVGKKFVTNREITNNLTEKTSEDLKLQRETTVKNDKARMKDFNTIKEGMVLTQFDEFLKLTYENYKKNYEGSTFQEESFQVGIPKKSGKSLYDDEFEIRKSQLNEKLKKTFEGRSSVSLTKRSVVDAEETEDVFEEVHYLSARVTGQNQKAFSGLHSINLNSKCDKLTASTIASIGGFHYGEDNWFN
jgi:hypothetical protein